MLGDALQVVVAQVRHKVPEANRRRRQYPRPGLGILAGHLQREPHTLFVAVARSIAPVLANRDHAQVEGRPVDPADMRSGHVDDGLEIFGGDDARIVLPLVGGVAHAVDECVVAG